MRWWGIAPVALALSAGIAFVQPLKAQNLAAAANGGKVLSWTSQEDAKSWAAANLIDGQRRKIGSSWSSPLTGGAVPQEVVIELPGGQPVEIDKVIISLNTGPPFLYSEFWAKDITVLVSATGSTPQEFTPVAQATLAKSEADQAITFAATPARFVKLRIDSAQSPTAPHVELAEVEVYARGTGPAAEVVPAATATPASELATPPSAPPALPATPTPALPTGVTGGEAGPALPSTPPGAGTAPGGTGPIISTTPDPNAPVAGPVPPTGVTIAPPPPVTVPSTPAMPGAVAPGPGGASGLGPAPAPAPAPVTAPTPGPVIPEGAAPAVATPTPGAVPPVTPALPTPPVGTTPPSPVATTPVPPSVTTVAPEVPQPSPTAPQPPTESLAVAPADAPAFVDPGSETEPTPTIEPATPIAPTPGPAGEAAVSAPTGGGTEPTAPVPATPVVAPTPATTPTTPPAPVTYAGPVKNLAAQSAGGTVMASTFVNEEFSNARLNNGIRGVDADEEVWTSAASPKYPHDLVASFANGEVHLVSKVVVCGPGMLELFGDRMPKDVEVLVSTTDTNEESFTKVASTQLKMVSEDQAIEFPPVAAKYVKLRILSNHGAPRFVELSELEVWGDPAPVTAAAAAPAAPVTAPTEATPAQAPPAPAVTEPVPPEESATTVPAVPTDIQDPEQLDKLIRDIEDVLARLRALRQTQSGG